MVRTELGKMPPEGSEERASIGSHELKSKHLLIYGPYEQHWVKSQGPSQVESDRPVDAPGERKRPEIIK